MKLIKLFSLRFTLVLIIEVIVVSSLSFIIFNKFQDKKAGAATSWADCMQINTNERIACIGRSSELSGIRYGKFNSPSWLNYWRSNGYPELTSMAGSFGNSCKGDANTCTWWTTDRYKPTTNFLGCNGFVNVVLYLALGYKTYAGSYSGGYQYLTFSKNGQTEKVFNVIRYPKFEDLQAGDLLVIPGHISIMSRKSPSQIYPRRFYAVQALGNQYSPSSTGIYANSKTHEYSVRDFDEVKSNLTVLRLRDGQLPSAQSVKSL